MFQTILIRLVISDSVKVELDFLLFFCFLIKMSKMYYFLSYKSLFTNINNCIMNSKTKDFDCSPPFDPVPWDDKVFTREKRNLSKTEVVRFLYAA